MDCNKKLIKNNEEELTADEVTKTKHTKKYFYKSKTKQNNIHL